MAPSSASPPPWSSSFASSSPLNEIMSAPTKTNQTRRKIRLSFPATGEFVVAELLEDEAPQICAQIWNWLPVQHKSIHGQYSGPEIFVLLDNPQPIAEENQKKILLPGE